VGRRNYRYFIQFLFSLTFHMLFVFGFCLYYTMVTRHNLATVSTISSIVLMIFVLLLIVPVCGLTGFHVILMVRGRTTNEQVTGKFKNHVNPFDYDCLLNCGQVFISSNYPRLIRPSPSPPAQKLKVTTPKRSRAYEIRINEKQLQPMQHNGNSKKHKFSNTKLDPYFPHRRPSHRNHTTVTNGVIRPSHHHAKSIRRQPPVTATSVPLFLGVGLSARLSNGYQPQLQPLPSTLIYDPKMCSSSTINTNNEQPESPSLLALNPSSYYAQTLQTVHFIDSPSTGGSRGNDTGQQRQLSFRV